MAAPMHIAHGSIVTYSVPPTSRQVRSCADASRIAISSAWAVGSCQTSRRLCARAATRSEEHTSELQSPCNLVCRLLLEKKKKNQHPHDITPTTAGTPQQNSDPSGAPPSLRRARTGLIQVAPPRRLTPHMTAKSVLPARS